nr:hypothetical protein [Gammaproteobacteria bacterium]
MDVVLLMIEPDNQVPLLASQAGHVSIPHHGAVGRFHFDQAARGAAIDGGGRIPDFRFLDIFRADVVDLMENNGVYRSSRGLCEPVQRLWRQA